MQYIYEPKHYYQRIKTFLREYKKPKVNIPIDMQRFLALLRSSIRLGIIGRERFQYWKFLLWTLIRRPRLFSLAITFAILFIGFLLIIPGIIRKRR